MSVKNHAILIAMLFAFFSILSCGDNSKSQKNAIMQTEPSLIEISIGGMTCTGCEQTIQAGIMKLEGIKSVKASHIAGNALVEYYPGLTDTVKIKEAVTRSGYAVK